MPPIPGMPAQFGFTLSMGYSEDVEVSSFASMYMLLAKLARWAWDFLPACGIRGFVPRTIDMTGSL